LLTINRLSCGVLNFYAGSPLAGIKASMVARSPVSEEPYEISLDCYGVSDGPKKGRMRAIQKVFLPRPLSLVLSL